MEQDKIFLYPAIATVCCIYIRKYGIKSFGYS